MVAKQLTTVRARAMALLAVVWVASAAQAPPVKVTVVESTAGNATTYSYHVYNGSSQAIVGLTIGFDRRSGRPQLRAVPLGWTLEQGLPASSATAPRGWTARVVTTEESDSVDIEWSSDAGSQWDIKPGTTATGFSVKVAKPSAEYRTARFEVRLGNAARVSGSLEAGRAARD